MLAEKRCAPLYWQGRSKENDFSPVLALVAAPAGAKPLSIRVLARPLRRHGFCSACAFQNDSLSRCLFEAQLLFSAPSLSERGAVSCHTVSCLICCEVSASTSWRGEKRGRSFTQQFLWLWWFFSCLPPLAAAPAARRLSSSKSSLVLLTHAFSAPPPTAAATATAATSTATTS